MLQGDTLAPILLYYLPRLCASNIDWFNEKINIITVAKARSKRYPVQTITDVDYTDNMALLANTPSPGESLPHSLERAAGSIGLLMNADKAELMSFKQRGDISTLNGRSLKLVDKVTYLGSRVSSTENDTTTRLAKAWTAIDRQSVIWKSDSSDKANFFHAAVASILPCGLTTWTLTKHMEKKLDGNCTICASSTPW